MQCITPHQVADLLGSAGFSVVSNLQLHRTALRLEPKLASQQMRIGGRPTPQVNRFVEFVETLNRWLPTNQRRLLWVDHWSDAFPSVCELFIAAREGLGETRSISDAPGHYFEAYGHRSRQYNKRRS